MKAKRKNSLNKIINEKKNSITKNYKSLKKMEKQKAQLEHHIAIIKN
jgi:hypothetical protein